MWTGTRRCKLELGLKDGERMDGYFRHLKLRIFPCISFKPAVGVSHSEDKAQGLQTAWHRPVPQNTMHRSRGTTAKEKGSKTWLPLPALEGRAQGHLQSHDLQKKYCHLLMVPAESRAGACDVGSFPSMDLEQDMDKSCLGPWAAQACGPCWRNPLRCAGPCFCLFPAVTLAMQLCLKKGT